MTIGKFLKYGSTIVNLLSLKFIYFGSPNHPLQIFGKLGFWSKVQLMERIIRLNAVENLCLSGILEMNQHSLDAGEHCAPQKLTISGVNIASLIEAPLNTPNTKSNTLLAFKNRNIQFLNAFLQKLFNKPYKEFSHLVLSGRKTVVMIFAMGCRTKCLTKWTIFAKTSRIIKNSLTSQENNRLFKRHAAGSVQAACGAAQLGCSAKLWLCRFLTTPQLIVKPRQTNRKVCSLFFASDITRRNIKIEGVTSLCGEAQLLVVKSRKKIEPVARREQEGPLGAHHAGPAAPIGVHVAPGANRGSCRVDPVQAAVGHAAVVLDRTDLA